MALKIIPQNYLSVPLGYRMWQEKEAGIGILPYVDSNACFNGEIIPKEYEQGSSF